MAWGADDASKCCLQPLHGDCRETDQVRGMKFLEGQGVLPKQPQLGPTIVKRSSH